MKRWDGEAEEGFVDGGLIVNNPWFGVQTFYLLTLLGSVGLFGWFCVRLGSHRLGRWLVSHRIVNPVRALWRLRRRFPGWKVTEVGIQGCLDGRQVLLNGLTLELMIAPPRPQPFTLTPIEKEPFFADIPLLTEDPVFDKRYSVVSDDPLFLAYFDAPTRRRLLRLRNVSGDEFGLRLSPGTEPSGWLVDFMRGHAIADGPRHPDVRKVGGTLAWYLDEMLHLARGFDGGRDIGERLRHALQVETVPALRDHFAALWCGLADAGTLDNTDWPPPTHPQNKDPLFTFLHHRAKGSRKPAVYRDFLPDCGPRLQAVFLRDMAAWPVADQIALIEHGLRHEQGYALVLEAACQLGGQTARRCLLQEGARLHDFRLASYRRRLPELLSALADMGSHQDTLDLVWGCLQRLQHPRVCLEILGRIGTAPIIAKLAGFRGTIEFEHSGYLETAIFELQHRHRLLGDGGNLSLVTGDDGRLSRPEAQDGGLTPALSDPKG